MNFKDDLEFFFFFYFFCFIYLCFVKANYMVPIMKCFMISPFFLWAFEN